MKKLDFRHPSLAIALVLAVALLAVSGINVTKSALTYHSDAYKAQIEMDDIGVALCEKSAHDSEARIVSYRNIDKDSNDWNTESGALLENMLEGDELLCYGKPYTEELSVHNGGTIDEYVRVTVSKYWVDRDGNKTADINPGLIDLHFTNTDEWLIDEDASTPERTVLYYCKKLDSNADTSNFTDLLTIYVDKKMLKTVTQTEGSKIVTSYNYDGYRFVIDAEVDAVQDHNANEAAHSSWGKHVNISDGYVSIVK